MEKPHSYTAEAFNDLTCTQLSSSSYSIAPNQRHRHVTSHRTQQIKSLSTRIHTHTHMQTHTQTQTHTHAHTHYTIRWPILMTLAELKVEEYC